MAVICEGRVSSPPSPGPEGGRELNPVSLSVMALPVWPTGQNQKEDNIEEEEENKPQFDIWNSIQESNKAATAATDLPPPYVHPLLRRSSSMLSQKSMDVCTESLGSETGSDDYYCEKTEYPDYDPEDEEDDEEEDIDIDIEGDGEYFCDYYGLSENKMNELAAVNYHCSVGKKSPTRAFPPPLPTISRRDRPCLHMKPQRKDGRLVVQAVQVPSQNYLQCQRQEGRLLLSFIEPAFEEIYPVDVTDSLTDYQMDKSELSCEVDEEEVDEEEEEKQIEEEEEAWDETEVDDGQGRVVGVEEEVEDQEEEAEEEEVEVVDRGSVVEVKISRQPQPQSGSGKVRRSSLVINKFVVGTPTTTDMAKAAGTFEGGVVKHDLPTEGKAVAPQTAAVETRGAGAGAVEAEGWGTGRRSPQRSGAAVGDDSRLLLFTTKKLMNREALLHQVRRCNYQHRPLFIWEPFCIATS